MRVFGPKTNDHPSIGEKCPACNVPFKARDFTTLVVLGPGNSPDAQQRAREGRAYNAIALECHVDCVGGATT